MKKDDREQGFEALLCPIRDCIAKDWKLKLCNYLDLYLEHLHGEQDINFKRAALILQNSSSFYSKRVDIMYNWVRQFALSLTTNEKQSSADGSHPKKQSNKRRLLLSDNLVCLDYTKPEGNKINMKLEKIKIKDSEQMQLNMYLKTSCKQTSSCAVLQSNQEEMGYKDEFRLHWKFSNAGQLHSDFFLPSSDNFISADMEPESDVEMSPVSDNGDCQSENEDADNQATTDNILDTAKQASGTAEPNENGPEVNGQESNKCTEVQSNIPHENGLAGVEPMECETAENALHSNIPGGNRNTSIESVETLPLPTDAVLDIRPASIEPMDSAPDPYESDHYEPAEDSIFKPEENVPVNNVSEDIFCEKDKTQDQQKKKASYDPYATQAPNVGSIIHRAFTLESHKSYKARLSRKFELQKEIAVATKERNTRYGGDDLNYFLSFSKILSGRTEDYLSYSLRIRKQNLRRIRCTKMFVNSGTIDEVEPEPDEGNFESVVIESNNNSEDQSTEMEHEMATEAEKNDLDVGVLFGVDADDLSYVDEVHEAMFYLEKAGGPPEAPPPPVAPKDSLAHTLEIGERMASYLRTNDEILHSAKVVAQWHLSIQDVIKASESNSKFDVHAYGTKIIDQFESLGNERLFSEVVDGQPRKEICRYLLSSLMLANTYNVELSKTNPDELGKDCLKLKLISTVRHHEELDANVGAAAAGTSH